MNPAGAANFPESISADENPDISAFDSINTVAVGVCCVVFALSSAGGGGGACFLCLKPPKPPISKPPNLLAIIEDADCSATSYAEGISGPALAAGSGSPLAVAPMRIICSTGIPFNLDISFAISDIHWAAVGCMAVRVADRPLPLNASPILTASLFWNSRSSS